MNEMYDMVEEPLTFEPWRKLMTIKAGYYTTLGKVSIDGTTQVAVQADSLAFESMDEDKFREFFAAFLQAFVDKYGRKLTLAQLDAWVGM